MGFHSQCSLDPPRYAVWISKANHSYAVAVTADVFAVHRLGPAQRHLAQLFGEVTGDRADKFEHCAWHPGTDGVPLLDDCPQRLVGRRIALLDPGTDHVCVVLALIEPVADTEAGDPPLRLSDVADFEPGHAG